MQSLLKLMWDIALWRRDPGELPASWALFALTGFAYASASYLQAWMLYGRTDALGRAAADLIITVAFFWLLFAVAGRRSRFLQAGSALLGTATLLAPLMMLLLALKAPAESHYAVALVVWAGSVAMIIWYLFIVGHIVRTALERSLALGMAVSVTYLLASSALLTRLYPEPG
jgi:hypothetical protein